MCYDVPTSLCALTVGLLSAGALFALRRPVFGVFVFTYVLMQLAEALIWHGIDTDDTYLNRKGVDLASTNLAIHALSVCVAIYVFAKTHTWSYTRRVFMALLTMLTIVLAIMSIYAKRSMAVVGPSPCNSATCRLHWNWDYRDEREQESVLRISNWRYPAQIVLIIALMYIAQVQDLGAFVLIYASLIVLAYLITPAGPTRWYASMSTTWCMLCALGAPVLAIWVGMMSSSSPSSRMI